MATREAAAIPESLMQRFTARARTLPIRRGQLILTSGTVSDEVYLVLEGEVRVSLFSPGGREMVFRDLGAGGLFGELAAIDGEPRSTTIVATEDGRLALIPAVAFREAVAGAEGGALWLAERLARQVRSLTSRVFELTALNVRGRLHCELLRMCALAGVEDNRAELRRVPTHEALAARIGTHREAVTREIGYLASVGILVRGPRRLLVNDVARLAAIVGEATGEADYLQTRLAGERERPLP